MRKTFKWFGIVAAVLLAIIIIGIVAIPILFPVEKIKDIATARLSETLGREVKIEKVSFNLFTGIKLEKISIANRAGFTQEPFVSADALTLRYAFWPIFQRHIIIQEVVLEKPQVLIEKNARGEFNFSDLIAAKQKTTQTQPAKPSDNFGFSLIVDAFSIRDGQIKYIDHAGNSQSTIKNIRLSLSGITLALLKPLDFSLAATANYQGKDIPLSLDGQIALDLANETISLPGLTLGIAGEKAALAAKISNLQAGPWIDFSLTSSQMGIDPLLAIFASGAPTKKEKVDLNKMVNGFTAAIPSKLRVKGRLDVNNITCFDFKVDKALFNLSLADKNAAAEIKEVKIYGGGLKGNVNVNLKTPGLGYSGELKLAGFNAAPFSNAVVSTFLTNLPDYKDLINKVYGTLDLTLIFKGHGVNTSDILANSEASGNVSLRNGELKRLKTIDALAEKLKTNVLKQDLKISELSSGFTYKNQILTLKQLALRDHDVNILFFGGLDLKRARYVTGNRLTLKGSPSLTQNLPKEFAVFKNDKGWLAMEFELQGDLKKPLPVPQLNKPFETVVGKFKIKVDAKKVEIEQAAQQAVSAEGQKFKEEAKQQIKNLLKLNP